MVLELAHNCPLAEGDLVQIAVTANDLRVMQKEYGGWKPGMEEVLFAAFVDYVVSHSHMFDFLLFVFRSLTRLEG